MIYRLFKPTIVFICAQKWMSLRAILECGLNLMKALGV